VVQYIYSEQYGVDFRGHVFPVEKYRLIYERLEEHGVFSGENVFEPEMPSREDLLLVVTPEYLDDLENLRWTMATIRSEMALTDEIVRFSKLTVGGTVLACVRGVEAGIGFHIGGGFHHAFADHAEGFCYINDIAVGIRKVQGQKKVKRVTVIDCDLHQGNGTANIFRDDDSVFTFSIHQEHLYPIKERSSVDIGLDDFAGDDEYLELLSSRLPEAVDDFGPDLVLYVAGADPYKGDRLGTLRLTKEGLRERDRIVIEFARRKGIPVVVVLAGGYAAVTQDTVEIHVNTGLVCEEVEQKAG
jgi:acetoin utilization deacetylase AcuC-like enzyme